MFYYTMWHKGGLREAIETIWEIEEKTFLILTESGLYKTYCFDERLEAMRYILNNIENNLGMPTWLLVSKKRQY